MIILLLINSFVESLLLTNILSPIRSHYCQNSAILTSVHFVARVLALILIPALHPFTTPNLTTVILCTRPTIYRSFK